MVARASTPGRGVKAIGAAPKLQSRALRHLQSACKSHGPGGFACAVEGFGKSAKAPEKPVEGPGVHAIKYGVDAKGEA